MEQRGWTCGGWVQADAPLTKLKSKAAAIKKAAAAEAKKATAKQLAAKKELAKNLQAVKKGGVKTLRTLLDKLLPEKKKQKPKPKKQAKKPKKKLSRSEQASRWREMWRLHGCS